jgi:hypothetical protein
VFPVFVIDPRDQDCPGLDSDEVSPTNGPMLEPANRCQSPISTASPNAVSVEIPRRQLNRSTTGGELAVRGYRLDRCVEAVPAPGGQDDGCVGGLERNLTGGLIEGLPTQPGVVDPGPGLPTGVDDPLTQQKLGQPVPLAHHVAATFLPSPHQIPRRLPSHRRVSDLDDLAHLEQPRQQQRVPGVGLDPVPGRSGDPARRRNQAAEPMSAQVPHQPEPGWPAS